MMSHIVFPNVSIYKFPSGRKGFLSPCSTFVLFKALVGEHRPCPSMAVISTPPVAQTKSFALHARLNFFFHNKYFRKCALTRYSLSLPSPHLLFLFLPQLLPQLSTGTEIYLLSLKGWPFLISEIPGCQLECLSSCTKKTQVQGSI
jgi:hypothetical protein